MEELADYYHWDDTQSLQQAVWVAQENPFEMEAILRWSEQEGMVKKYEKFVKKLKDTQ